MIKFWAFIYRCTGWYSPFARLAEYEHVRTCLPDIEEHYKSPDNDMALEDHIDITIGMWQAEHGFYRRFKL